MERGLGALARRKRLAAVSVGVAVILVRVALLPWMPVPEPRVHDEFSYLLAADTFVHGRLANPPHPLWTFFDTFHVLQHPTYASMYPPAQGAALAVGKLLGSPWVGVLLSSAAMCMAITWMLQVMGAGGVGAAGRGGLALCRFAIFSYWTNSYWGGSVAAIGAALVLGALPRMLRLSRPRDAVICGVGAGILANSRPLEGFVFCLPVAVAILWWCVRGGTNERSARVRRTLFPLAPVLAIAVGLVGYYKAKVGGSATTFPEMVETRAMLTSPIFVWQGDKPRLTYANQQFDDFYNNDVPDLYRPGWRSALNLTEWKSGYVWRFFLRAGAGSIALLALPWVLLRERVARLLLVQFVFSALGLIAVAFFHPHYAAPLMTTLMVLVTLGFQEMSRLRFLGRGFGVGVVRVAAVYGVLIGPVDFVKFAIAQSPRLSAGWSAVRPHLPHYWVFVVAAGALAALLVLADRGERTVGAFALLQVVGWLAVLLVILGGQARHDDYPFDTGNRDGPFRRPIEQRLDGVPGQHLDAGCNTGTVTMRAR